MLIKKLTTFLETNKWIYPLVFFISCLVQMVLYFKTGGAHPSTDFTVIYEPKAIELMLWLKGINPSFNISGYTLTHSLYIFYIAAIYTIFGVGSRNIAVLIQILFLAVSFTLTFHILKKIFSLKFLPALIIFYSLIFFDNIQWAAWLLSDNLYKPLFLMAVALIVYFYINRKFYPLLISLIISTIVLSLTRIDAIIQIAPFYLLLLWQPDPNYKISTDKNSSSKNFYRPGIILSLIGIIVISLFFRQHISNFIETIIKVCYEKFKNGDIIVGLGYRVDGITHIEEWDSGRARDISYLTTRFIRLFILRIYNFLNTAPPFWSLNHKIYYTINMLPLYIFALIGFIRSIVQKNAIFLTVGLMFGSTIILHGLTRVDGALRTMYTPLMFLIILAGFGVEAIILKIKTRRQRIKVNTI